MQYHELFKPLSNSRLQNICQPWGNMTLALVRWALLKFRHRRWKRKHIHDNDIPDGSKLRRRKQCDLLLFDLTTLYYPCQACNCGDDKGHQLAKTDCQGSYLHVHFSMFRSTCIGAKGGCNWEDPPFIFHIAYPFLVSQGAGASSSWLDLGSARQWITGTGAYTETSNLPCQPDERYLLAG